MQALVANGGTEAVKIAAINVAASDGKQWVIKPVSSPATDLAARKDSHTKFSVAAPDDASLTRAYFSRPNREQPLLQPDG